MSCNTITYRKSIPSEVIVTGDIIMIDLNTGYIRKSVLEKPFEHNINSKLVVGVCVWSENDSPMQKTIDGGSSVYINRKLVDGGDSNTYTETIIINGGDSNLSLREIIKVAYSGEQTVNIYGRSHIGDRLCISKEPGRARAIHMLDDCDEDLRTIGKITGYLNNEKTQAKVLLNIE